MSWYKALNFEIPFRFAVSAIEWKHANSFAPSSVLNPPETLDFTFNTLMEASLALSKSCDNDTYPNFSFIPTFSNKNANSLIDR